MRRSSASLAQRYARVHCVAPVREGVRRGEKTPVGRQKVIDGHALAPVKAETALPPRNPRYVCLHSRLSHPRVVQMCLRYRCKGNAEEGMQVRRPRAAHEGSGVVVERGVWGYMWRHVLQCWSRQ